MKSRMFIWSLVAVLAISMTFMGIAFTGCKKAEEVTEEAVAEEVTEEAVAEEVTEEAVAEEVTEEAVEEEGVPVNADGDVISIASINFTQFPCYQNREKGSEMAAEDYGIKHTTIVPTEITVESYIETMINAIAQDFDAIICEPWVTDPFGEPLQMAKDKGLPVVVVHVPYPDPDMYISQVIINNEAYGVTLAGIVNEEKDGKANVLFMMTNPDVANQATQKASFEETCAELYPDIVIVNTEFTEADAVKSAERLESAFTAYPEIDTVIFVESGGVVVAASVAEEMGILDKLTIIGIDDPPDLIAAIRDGKVWGSLNQNFSKQGYEAVRNICDYFLGNPFPKETDAGIVLIRKENVDTYLDDMFGPVAMKGMPYTNLD
jgi:ribose transport system substrate-binding protein